MTIRDVRKAIGSVDEKIELMKIYKEECENVKYWVMIHIYDYLAGTDKFEEYCEKNNVEEWSRMEAIEGYLGSLCVADFEDFMYCCGDEEIEEVSERSDKKLVIERVMVNGKKVGSIYVRS